MSIFTKTAAIALTALALSSAALVSNSEASPRGHGGGGHHRPGGWGGHGGHGGWGGHGPRGGHWGHRGGWGRVGIVYGGYAPRCRLVQRVNYYGEVVGMRRVCNTYPSF